MKITTTFLYFDKLNGNGRIYPKKLLPELIEQSNELISRDMFLGEFSNGERDFPTEDILLSRVSHKIDEIHYNVEKNAIEGIIKILDTPEGKKIKEMLKNNEFNSLFSVASRGMGTIDSSNYVENFKLSTYDIIPKYKSSWENLPNESNE